MEKKIVLFLSTIHVFIEYMGNNINYKYKGSIHRSFLFLISYIIGLINDCYLNIIPTSQVFFSISQNDESDDT